MSINAFEIYTVAIKEYGMSLDSYIIRTPKPKISVNSSSPVVKKTIQSTLESLKGVVILEELQRNNSMLQRTDVSTELKLNVLKALASKKPAKAILEKSGLWESINDLIHSGNSLLAKEAQHILDLWKNFISSTTNRPVLEVKCNAKTKKFRESARNLIFKALSENKETEKAVVEDEYLELVSFSQNCAQAIEKEIYFHSKRLVHYSYRRTVRKIVFAIKHKNSLKNDIMQKEIDAKTLVNMYFQK